MAYFPGWGHLNSYMYLARGGGNLNTNKLRFDWYIKFNTGCKSGDVHVFNSYQWLVFYI